MPSNNNHICQQCLRSLRRAARARGRGASSFATRLYSSNDNERTFRLGVIGSGPAGFYSAYRVMQKIPNARVDMYEALPVPFGLVRYGVAPDHPEVKNCQDKFEEVAESDRFTFVGNVAVGKDVSLPDLVPHYDAILFAYGASEDKTLGVPGESLGGIYSARAFVAWYNGLPGHQETDMAAMLENAEEAVVIGQGNVALDVARVLLTDVDVLRRTDMATRAIEALSKSRVKRVRVVGRRGTLQAAFTIKELRELMTLPSLSFDPIPSNLFPCDGQIKALPRQQKRITQLLVKGSENEATSSTKSWALDFMLSPVRFQAAAAHETELDSIQFERNRFKAETDCKDRSAVVESCPDEEGVVMRTKLAFRSVGYKSRALRTLSDVGVPFDGQRGIIPNDMCGRVLAEAGERQAAGQHVAGMYCAGWVKRGPTGVIASTMLDAFSTADAIVQDWEGGAAFIGSGGAGVRLGWEAVGKEALNKGVRRVGWEDWKRIDEEEKERGKGSGKVREKITEVGDMLKVLDG